MEAQTELGLLALCAQVVGVMSFREVSVRACVPCRAPYNVLFCCLSHSLGSLPIKSLHQRGNPWPITACVCKGLMARSPGAVQVLF